MEIAAGDRPVMSSAERIRRPGWHRAADVSLLLLVVVLTAFTTVILVVPAVVPAVVNEQLDVTIVTASLLVSLAVAAVAWGRGRVAHDSSAVLRGSAFGVLSLLNGAALTVALIGAEALVGLSLDDPGQFPLVVGVAGRGLAAGLLVLAGYAAVSRRMPLVRPVAVLVVPLVAMSLILVLGYFAQERLPELAPPAAMQALATNPTMQLPPGSAPILVLAQFFIGILFLAAAVLAHRSFRRSGRGGDMLLAAGLLIAAFSQVHGALHPGGYASVVTSGDLLRLASYAVLLVGVVAESRDDLADLRAATIEVRRLADAEVAAAALEERARLAREIHDGLAQDLWYAKLKQSRLARTASLDDAGQRLSEEVAGALDNALAEARSAVAAMRRTGETGPLIDLLTRLVDDFADRFALRAELTSSGPEPELEPKAQAEVLRIVQEALTNARKHADATVVRVALESWRGAADHGQRQRPWLPARDGGRRLRARQHAAAGRAHRGHAHDHLRTAWRDACRAGHAPQPRRGDR